MPVWQELEETAEAASALGEGRWMLQADSMSPKLRSCSGRHPTEPESETLSPITQTGD